MADELYLIKKETLTEIADAVRAKTGADTSETIKVSEMATQIQNIEVNSEEGNTINKFLTGSLTELTLKDFEGVTSITPELCFANQTQLASINLPPNQITKIESSAFYNTAFYKNINNWTLLTDDTRPPCLLIHNGYLLDSNSMYIYKSEVLDLSDYEISLIAEKGISLSSSSCTTFICPNSLKYLNDEALGYASTSPISNIQFNEGLLEIGDYVFYNQQLTELIFPNSLKKIGTLGTTKKLTTIKFGTDLEEMSGFSTSSQPSLSLVDFRSVKQVPSLTSYYSMPQKPIYIVPDELYDEWIIATNWASLANYIVKASDYVEEEITE